MSVVRRWCRYGIWCQFCVVAILLAEQKKAVKTTAKHESCPTDEDHEDAAVDT